MYKVYFHKDFLKSVRKFPKRLKSKVEDCISYIIKFGFRDLRYRIKPLKNYSGKFKYWEIIISRDYRLVYRIESRNVYFRYAGTHNYLGTG